MVPSIEILVLSVCILALTSGCNRHERSTESSRPASSERTVDVKADCFIQVHYGGKLTLAKERSTNSATTSLIRPNELAQHVPKNGNRVAVIEVPSERILNNGTDEIWLTTESVLMELRGLGFQRATVESHHWGRTQILTNVMFTLK